MRTAKRVYRRFIEFEERVASIYLQFASRFSSDRKLGGFWFEMAMEEKQHAGLLQFCLCESLFAADLPENAEIHRLSGLLKNAEKRAADRKLSIVGAFSLAIDIETIELNAIYSHLTTGLHTSTYLVKRKIGTSVPGHLESLVAAAREYGVPDKVLKKAQGFSRAA